MCTEFDLTEDPTTVIHQLVQFCVWMGNQAWSQSWSQGSKSPGSLGQTWDQAKSLKFILIDSIFLLSPCPENPVTQGVSPSFPKMFCHGKNIFLETPSQDFPGVREMGDAQAIHDRDIKTWCAQTSYPECLYSGKKYRYERFDVE